MTAKEPKDHATPEGKGTPVRRPSVSEARAAAQRAKLDAQAGAHEPKVPSVKMDFAASTRSGHEPSKLNIYTHGDTHIILLCMILLHA